jgi:hypothetical protein
VTVSNGRRGGANVAARWSRAAIEAPPITGAFDFAPTEPAPMSGIEHKGA